MRVRLRTSTSDFPSEIRYIDGETLSARIHRGPMDFEQMWSLFRRHGLCLVSMLNPTAMIARDNRRVTKPPGILILYPGGMPSV